MQGNDEPEIIILPDELLDDASISLNRITQQFPRYRNLVTQLQDFPLATECSIYFESLEERLIERDTIKRTNCGHGMCTRCIERLVHSRTPFDVRCPMCRVRLD